MASSKPKVKPKVWLYMDYNGVLNQEGLLSLHDFMIKLDFLNDLIPLNISLLSHLMEPCQCNRTLNQIADAGVLTIFDDFVFTRDMISNTARRPVWKTIFKEFDYEPLCTREHPPLPEYPSHPGEDLGPRDPVLERIKPPMAHFEDQRQRVKYCFTVFHGGKDQFIYSQHRAPSMNGSESLDRIIFVDDKYENVEAVRALTQLPEFRGEVKYIEMRRHRFTNWHAWQPRNLQDLYTMIERNVHDVLAAEHARNTMMLQNIHADHAAPHSGAAPRSVAAEREPVAADRSGAAPSSGAADQSWDHWMQLAVKNNEYV